MSVRELESDSHRLVIEAEWPASGVHTVWQHWVRPELLTRWWSVDAELDVRLGGRYRVSWPAHEWHLRGRYTRVEVGRALAFTWQWDHEPDRPLRHVAILFEPESGGGGTRLTLTHGVYGDDAAEHEDRESHRQGWLHFLGRLEELLARQQQN